MEFFTALFALVAICFFLVMFFDINAASAPLMSMGCMMLVITLLGIMDLLTVGYAILYFFAAAGIAAVFIWKKPKVKDIAEKFLRPGIVFFILVSIAFYFILMDQDPDFRYWDEYSFWGIAAKTMWTERRLYTLVDNSMIVSAYLPGLPTVGLLFQFFSKTFTEWKVYLGYDVLMMAGMSALFGNNKWKNVLANIACTAFAVLSIYAFFYGSEGLYAYANGYSDFPLGIIFGSVLLLWFVPSRKGVQEYISVIGGLLALTLMKDMGLAMGMIASGVIAVDIWINRAAIYGKDSAGKVPGAVRFFLVPLIPMAVICGIYFGWLRHFTAVTGIVSSDMGYDKSAIEILTGKDQYFIDTLHRMWDEIFVRQIVSFGPISQMILVFTIVALFTAVVSRKKKKVVSCVAFAFLMLFGFAVYFLFHAYLYTAVFYHSGGMSSFGRYMSSYSLGWMIAVAGLAISDYGDCNIPHLGRAWGVLVMAASVFATFHFTPVHPDQYLITSKKKNLQHLGLTETFYNDYMEFYGLLNNERIYFVCQESDGGEWFIFNYEFLPAFTVSTLGGGNFVPKDEGGLYDAEVDSERFVEYLLEQEVDYVYIGKSNEYFRDEFGHLFADHLESFYDGSANLYKIYPDGSGSLRMMPVADRTALEYMLGAQTQ